MQCVLRVYIHIYVNSEHQHVCVYVYLLSICPLCVLFLWSPFSLSLPLCRHQLGVKSSSEIHPQSLKFPPADFLGQRGTRFNQSWDKSRLTTLLYAPLLHPATLAIPSSSLILLHISQSATGNRMWCCFLITYSAPNRPFICLCR